MIVDVLGLGESINRYKPNKNITVGVNDIFKHFRTNYFVCVDLPKKFTSERLRNIIDHKSTLYTHLDCWKVYHPKVEMIQLANGRGNLKELDSEKYCYSNNSTFVATVLAYKLGAKRINLYGVDFSNHNHIKDNVKIQAIQHFLDLSRELEERGVSLCVTKESSLSDYLESF